MLSVITSNCKETSNNAANLGKLPEEPDDDWTDDEELHVKGEVPGVIHAHLVIPLNTNLKIKFKFQNRLTMKLLM